MTDLAAALSREQSLLLTTMAHKYLMESEWPVWQFTVDQVQPYLQRVADVLVGAGLAEQQDVVVQRLAGDALAAAVVLNHAGAQALVWDERYGWRTAVSRRHPIGKDTGTPPEGDGIRYLSTEQQPEAAELLAALTDGRRGSRRPDTIHPAGLAEVYAEAERLEREEGPLVWNRGDAVRQHLGASAADDYLARVTLAA
ncbi:hypothetical protein [Streptomyces ardesiacus]|uniref:hypothetical protein n=1 Tax=Streptomyces ardesiacus TaxID=285564 RepID=UPI003F49B45F